MNILIIGSGGREHALAWKISQSIHCSGLFIAPGNAGTSLHGRNLNIEINDFDTIKNACLEHQIQMVVVGPEDPLVKGIYDFFKGDDQLKNLIIIGPSKQAAMLEGSKAFAKAFMQRHNIPTAAYREFNNNNFDEGVQYLKQHSLPIVLKADGLAAGKGVLIINDRDEAIKEFELMLRHSKFGDAGATVIVEEFLTGTELSVFALTDGRHYVLLPEAKDYKRIGEKDMGLNTGGMGAISPVPFAGEAFMKKVKDKIIDPTINGLRKENLAYTGFVFFGLIAIGDEPWVIEYNCRLGDPETEVVLVRLQNDLVELLEATASGKLNKQKILIDKKYAATIVAVSGGYPGDYQIGFPIDLTYLEHPEARKHIDKDGGVMVFHAGTKMKNGVPVTNGGRVLAVSSVNDTLAEAVEGCLETLSDIKFNGMYYRTDIGAEFSE
ncbi:phosphoribosylamine--glycine ligase [soil metagenome]